MNNLLKQTAIDIESILKKEEDEGSSNDNFFALANITKELLPTKQYSREQLLEIWKNYRTSNERQNIFRLEPLLQEFKEIRGIENLKKCCEEGGVFGTFHYGDYRHVPFQITKSLQMDKTNSLNIVVDQDSYNSEIELKKWNKLREKYNVKYIVSEEENSGLKLLRLLRKGRSILLYLDGNTGSGDDSQPFNVQHITSTVHIRSGIFRLVQLLKKPMCIVIADKNANGESRLTAYKPITVNKDTLKKSIDYSYELFRNKLVEQPELWRFWFRHHRYVKEWDNIHINETHIQNIDWFNNKKEFGLDLETGNIFKI
ncbi:hypothetical protein V1503_25045 [Bacillus sp. SCS-151]|uniref:hypothetical protein n=1 Tax=Nanhaiella sioensis TaxID=3115293 RepID=UPI0039798AAE